MQKRKDEIRESKTGWLSWGYGATNSSAMHFTPSVDSHSFQTRQVKYFLCGLDIPVTHTEGHTETKPSNLSPVQSSVHSRVALFWPDSPSPLSPTTGGLVKRKEREKVNGEVLEKADSCEQLGNSCPLDSICCCYIYSQTVCLWTEGAWMACFPGLPPGGCLWKTKEVRKV